MNVALRHTTSPASLWSFHHTCRDLARHPHDIGNHVMILAPDKRHGRQNARDTEREIERNN